MPFAAFVNPLFQGDEDDSGEEDDFSLVGGGSAAAGSQAGDEENASWLANLALPGGSASPPLRRLHPTGAFGAQGRCLSDAGPAPLLGCGSSKPFPCIGGGSGGSSGSGSSSAEVLAAFRREMQSPLVLSALCALERYGLHPLGDDGEDFFCSLEGTAAGGP